jgi:hypothetical protein
MLANHSIMARSVAMILTFLSSITMVSALTVQYCSSLNTASGAASKYSAHLTLYISSH